MLAYYAGHRIVLQVEVAACGQAGRHGDEIERKHGKKYYSTWRR
jgi:hypothetical protein